VNTWPGEPFISAIRSI